MKLKIIGAFVIFLGLTKVGLAKVVVFVDQDNRPLQHVVVTSAIASDEMNGFANTMNQINKQFLPRVLAVKTGQLVNFPNSDNIRHHIYSFSDAKAFEVKLYSGKEAPPVSFDKPGVVVLGCNIHDQMLGYIYVSDAPQVWISNIEGRVKLPDEISEYEYWHPDLSVDHLQKETLSFNDSNLLTSTVVQNASNTITIKLSLKGNSLIPILNKRTFGSHKFSNGKY